jgi:hypothetical protein
MAGRSPLAVTLLAAAALILPACEGFPSPVPNRAAARQPLWEESQTLNAVQKDLLTQIKNESVSPKDFFVQE